MRHTTTHQKGLSLVELLVYIGIIVIVLLLTSQFAVSIIRGQTKSSEVQRVHQGVRRVVEQLNYDFRFAKSIATSTSVFNDPDGVLVFTDRASTTVQYDLANGVLQRTYGSSTPASITTNTVTVEEFRVRHIVDSLKGIDAIRVVLQISAGYPGTDQFFRKIYTTSVTRR